MAETYFWKHKKRHSLHVVKQNLLHLWYCSYGCYSLPPLVTSINKLPLMRKVFVFLLLFFLGFHATAAHACDASLSHGNTLTLNNHTYILFAMLRASNTNAALRDAERDFLCHPDTHMTSVYTNRYGEDVVIFHHNNETIQSRLVAGGAPYFIEDIKAPSGFYKNLEAVDTTPSTNHKKAQIGEYQKINGTITGIKESKKVTYINFDEDWKTDFTVLIDKKAWPLFAPYTLKKGDNITVRGWVQDYYGPMIKINTPEALKKTN